MFFPSFRLIAPFSSLKNLHTHQNKRLSHPDCHLSYALTVARLAEVAGARRYKVDTLLRSKGDKLDNLIAPVRKIGSNLGLNFISDFLIIGYMILKTL